MESSPNLPFPAATAAANLPPRASSSSPPSSPFLSDRPIAWTRIIRGPESDTGADISLADISGDGNADGGKKPSSAWNMNSLSPANCPVDNSVANSPVVVGAALWPSLSDSTKTSLKSDSGSSAPLQTYTEVTGLVASSSSSTTSDINHHPSSNHGQPVRQKSIRHDVGYNHNSAIKVSSSFGNEGSVRNNVQNHINLESGPRNLGGDRYQSRNSVRRGTGGPHPRGDGPRMNHGGRHDWNHQRGFNGRYAPPSMQSRVGHRGYVRSPIVSAPFIHPVGLAPMRPFMNPMGVPDMGMIYFSPAMPFVPPVHAPVFFHDPQLIAKIAYQIDYYFSNENLIKDTFLRRKMDQNGWVPISLIAGFKKVMQLTDNHELILEAVQSSSVVEAQGDKIRRRGDWMRWIMSPWV